MRITMAMAMDMEDDLDAFFDDVENAVKEVRETGEEEGGGEGGADGDGSGEERPAKRARSSAPDDGDATDAASPVPPPPPPPPPARPVKSVVASSVPVVSIGVAPPLPPGPPPAASIFGLAGGGVPPPPPSRGSAASSSHFAAGAYAGQPPLPPHPPPQINPDAKPRVRSAAGETWTDPTLAEFPANDFRLFVGNLARDLRPHHLEQHFSKYPSFAMAKIVTNKADGKSKGYGFVSLMDPKDCAKAIREMDQSWLGSRPIKVRLSEWKEREWKEVKKRGKAEKRKKKHFGL
ncbi:hypothetical protein ACHAWF_006812 [Thalassiosira exigua]